jgi:AAA domain
VSIHERDLEGHLTRALQEVLAGREPGSADLAALTGEAKACIDALVNALHADGVQAVYKAFTALVKDRPWLGKLASQSPEPALEGKGAQEVPEEPRYQLHRLDYFKNLPKREWSIEGVLREKGSSVFFGDGGCGKSAVVLSMMLHKAYGLDWIGGRKVKQGLVVWVAAEGEDEIYPRAYAWMLQHGLHEEPNILYIDEVVPLNNPAEVALFLERLQQQLTEMEITEPISSIVIDTYAECSPGADENDTKEAKSSRRRFIISARRLIPMSRSFTTRIPGAGCAEVRCSEIM